MPAGKEAKVFLLTTRKRVNCVGVLRRGITATVHRNCRSSTEKNAFSCSPTTGLNFIEPTDGAMIGDHSWPFEGYRVIQPLVLDEFQNSAWHAHGARNSVHQRELGRLNFSTDVFGQPNG